MKLAHVLVFILLLAVLSNGCTRSKKVREAKIKRELQIKENKKDIEELETSTNSIFFEPESDPKLSLTSYELDALLSARQSQRFILQDPKVLEAYPNGDTYDVYFYLGEDVTPRTYSYVFKVEKIRKEDLDLFVAIKSDTEGRIFLVLKKVKVSWPQQVDLEKEFISKQVVHAEFVEIKKLSRAKVIAEKMKIAKAKDAIYKAREEIEKQKQELEEDQKE